MKKIFLYVIGLIQFIFLVIYFANEPYIGSKLNGVYIRLGFGDEWQSVPDVLTFSVIALIFISIIFSMFSNLNKSLLTAIFGTFLEFTRIMLPYILGLDIIELFYVNRYLLFAPLMFISICFILILLKKIPNYKEQAKIKKEILEIGLEHPDFKLKNVAKRSKSDKSTIIRVTKKMIRNKEIYAEYFNFSKKFVFNISANVEAIDRLMNLYQQWEEEKIGKKHN
ncbi:MAG: hypothetical protein ACW98D_12225 [Promethearchaeota archaeon]|jgi:hypothetical protein